MNDAYNIKNLIFRIMVKKVKRREEAEEEVQIYIEDDDGL